MADYTGQVKVDETNPKILHLEWRNHLNMPEAAIPVATEWEGISFKERKKLDLNFNLHMVTRRSSLNPGETAKLRLTLNTPVNELPEGIVFVAKMVTYGEFFCRVRFSLNA